MAANVIRFTDAVYHRQNRYDFQDTLFSRRMLKILLLIDGKRPVEEISQELSTPIHTLMPEFASLVKLGLIQTKESIVSAGVSDLVFSDANPPPSEFSMTRLPANAMM